MTDAGSAVTQVRHGEDESLDIAFEKRSDTHRAGLLGGEDRRVGEADGAELAGGLAEHHDDGMGGRIVRLLDPIVGTDDHRLVDHGDGRIRALATLHGRPRLGQCLAHEELVVHGPMLADGLPARFGDLIGPEPQPSEPTAGAVA